LGPSPKAKVVQGSGTGVCRPALVFEICNTRTFVTVSRLFDQSLPEYEHMSRNISVTKVQTSTFLSLLQAQPRRTVISQQAHISKTIMCAFRRWLELLPARLTQGGDPLSRDVRRPREMCQHVLTMIGNSTFRLCPPRNSGRKCTNQPPGPRETLWKRYFPVRRQHMRGLVKVIPHYAPPLRVHTSGAGCQRSKSPVQQSREQVRLLALFYGLSGHACCSNLASHSRPLPMISMYGT
jgi:hypothetical protein